MSDERSDGLNWAQAKDRIDSGETRDKIAHPDPAASPLGTDAEAGGHGTAPEHIARSASAERQVPTSPPERGNRLPYGLLAAVAVILLIVLVWGL
jgi:hypothetical protein